MRGKTHNAASLFAAAIVFSFLNIDHKLMLLIGLFLGGYFPDIDIDTAKISKIFKDTSKVIRAFFGHREAFHSLLFPVAVYAAILIALPEALPFARGFLLGVVIHLFLDSFNKKGVPWLWPSKILRVRGPFKSNGVADTFLTTVFTFGAILVFAMSFL